MTLSSLGEFGLIARITARLPSAATTIIGPGDDAALVAVADGRVLASTDILVDGRHFRTDWCSALDVGHRAAAANMADIAAMGGAATALLVGVGLPANTDPSWAEQLSEGLAAEAASVGAAVVGGDVTACPVITVAVTALGDLAGRPPVLRSGARIGDIVAIAGRLGLAAAGHSVLSRGFRSPRALVEAYRRPQPPYHAGPAAAVHGATSMIDVSDGLLADLGHICVASQVSIDILRGTISVPQPMRDAATALGVDPYTWALTGGDDHALVATFPADVGAPDGWIVIGSVKAAPAGPGVTVNGRSQSGAAGWDHFKP